MYEDIILDHYQNPHNNTPLQNANYISEMNNPSCGDAFQMFARVENDIIQEAAFTGHGCAISTASASMLTDLVKQKKLAYVAKLTKETVLSMLGIDISPNRLKCALLPLETLQKLAQVKK